jgi:hypothetical protein
MIVLPAGEYVVVERFKDDEQTYVHDVIAIPTLDTGMFDIGDFRALWVVCITDRGTRLLQTTNPISWREEERFAHLTLRRNLPGVFPLQAWEHSFANTCDGCFTTFIVRMSTDPTHHDQHGNYCPNCGLLQ